MWLPEHTSVLATSPNTAYAAAYLIQPIVQFGVVWPQGVHTGHLTISKSLRHRLSMITFGIVCPC